MALAVAIGEPLAVWASKPRAKAFDSEAAHYAWSKRQADPRMKYRLAQLEQDEVGADFAEPWNFQYQVLIAPIPRFFTSWFPASGAPAPAHLSRHVVAHQPTRAHFTQTNALLSLMLVTGILREQQSWIEEVAFDP